MKNKRMIALLLLAVMVMVPFINAFAESDEIVIETTETEEETPEVEVPEIEGEVKCVAEKAAVEAAHKVRLAAVEDLGNKKADAIAAIARWNEARSELARAKAALDKAEATLAAAKEGKDAENIKDAEWCVAREKAVYDKWAAAVVTTEKAKNDAEAAWKAAVKAYEAAVAAENAAIREYNRCAAANLPLVPIDSELVGKVGSTLPVAGAY